MTQSDREGAALEPPWTPPLQRFMPTSVTRMPSLHLKAARLSSDLVDHEILKLCHPRSLLQLKGVCTGWREKGRELMCDEAWAAQHGLSPLALRMMYMHPLPGSGGWEGGQTLFD
eukprot:779529-Prymnesium_polylepis.1